MRQRFGSGFGLKDWSVFGTILLGSMMVMWAVLIRPHSFDWQDAGEMSATVKTLMSNKTVIGSPVIKAVVVLPSGGQTIVDVPLDSNARAGSEIILSVQADADNANRKRYFFSKAAK